MSRTPGQASGETAPARYVVGIDLGTTNSALAFVDTQDERFAIHDFPIRQLVAPGTVEPRLALPSFHYQPAAGEFAAGALRLPWSKDEAYVVGTMAREHGAQVPGRLVNSAKSWLCHAGVDRLADLLPWHGAADADRISPVEASARYLVHLHGAWNARFPDYPLAEQDVVLTLPASFDEVARELTVKAAARAGLARVVLIEEPQAAFYAWIADHADWHERVSPGQKILVCDIGGGTSDFTLIRVRQAGGGKVQFHRVAVGEHLILGGDNLDLALAHDVEARLGGGLEPRAWSALVQICRQVKERLLSAEAPERLSVHVPGTSSRLIGGGRQVELDRDEVRKLLIDGFLPRVALDARPVALRSGFQEFGLPYAPDAAITRYLAAFLSAHRHAGDEPSAVPTDHDPARPDMVLFNGGFFASPLLQQRLLDVLGGWFGDDRGWKPVVLANERLDLAVARGAAYYGMVRRGVGVRISAQLARSYFVGVNDTDAESAMCLLPAGVEEGQTVDAGRQFDLLIRQPVEFPLYASSTLLTVRAGELRTFDPEQMTALPPIRTVLQTGKKTAAAEHVAVSLHARLTEIGTLDVWCSEVDGPRTWKLQFDVRAATQTDVAGHAGRGESEGIVDERLVAVCRAALENTFSRPPNDPAHTKPSALVRSVAEATGLERHEWPPSLLRAMWQDLVELEHGRRTNEAHEARWLNLLGYTLRPGYGMALDDWRVAQTWRLLQGRLLHPGPMCRVEWWILWRRIAGGLVAGQQRALAEPLLGELRAAQRNVLKGRGSELRLGPHEGAELWRMLGSLEWLPVSWKAELGQIAMDLVPREKTAALRGASIWALGRIGSRVPLYGPLNGVVETGTVDAWIEQLMKLKQPPDTMPFALTQLARRTGDRFRDLRPTTRESVLRWLDDRQAPGHYIQLVREGGELGEEEQGLAFGESLPKGLRIR